MNKDDLHLIVAKQVLVAEAGREKMIKDFREDPNNIVNWYPKLRQVAETPATCLINIDYDTVGDFLDVRSTAKTKHFLQDLGYAQDAMGYPNFLRSGQMSAKHDWEDTCFIGERKSYEAMYARVFRILEANAMAWGTALPTCFAVRELIKTTPVFHAFDGKMPITKERRVFIRGRKVECVHPYWPAKAFLSEGLTTEHAHRLESMNFMADFEINHLTEISLPVAEVFPGYWSLDWLQDTTGKWWAIDMALGERSYHWKGCEHVRETMEMAGASQE